MLAGDFNVIPDARDATRPEDWVNDALYLPQTRFKFRELISLGLIDALRATTDARRPLQLLGLSGWRLAEEQRHPHRPSAPVPGGCRQAATVTIDKEMRGRDKASDHTPVRIDLAA